MAENIEIKNEKIGFLGRLGRGIGAILAYPIGVALVVAGAITSAVLFLNPPTFFGGGDVLEKADQWRREAWTGKRLYPDVIFSSPSDFKKPGPVSPEVSSADELLTSTAPKPSVAETSTTAPAATMAAVAKNPIDPGVPLKPITSPSTAEIATATAVAAVATGAAVAATPKKVEVSPVGAKPQSQIDSICDSYKDFMKSAFGKENASYVPPQIEKTTNEGKESVKLSFNNNESKENFLQKLTEQGKQFKAQDMSSSKIYYSDGKTLHSFENESKFREYIISKPPISTTPKVAEPKADTPRHQSESQSLSGPH